MWSRIRKVFVPPESKSSRVARLVALEHGGRPRWTPRDYSALAREGYARNAIVHQGRLDSGVHLLTKPFSFAELASKVRDLLDAPPT